MEGGYERTKIFGTKKRWLFFAVTRINDTMANKYKNALKCCNYYNDREQFTVAQKWKKIKDKLKKRIKEWNRGRIK